MMKKINKKLDNYEHAESKRKNNPPVGLVSSATDKPSNNAKYQHDPHVDPFLSWAGKHEKAEFEVPTISLHTHERIDPERMAKQFLRIDNSFKQGSLFEQPDNEPPLNKALDFYQHEQD